MDARTIDKLITKGKGEYLFGRRAFVEVAIPVTSLGSEPPARPKLGRPGVIQGYWSSRSGKHTVLTAIHEVSSRVDPRRRRSGQSSVPHFVVRENWPGGGFDYRWWEGERRYFRGKPARGTLVKVVPLPKKMVEAYKRYRDWMCRYGGRERTGIAEFDAFVDAGAHARGLNAGLRGQQLILQYAVKYFQPDTRKAFAKALAAAMRVSDRAEFGAKLLGLPSSVGA